MTTLILKQCLPNDVHPIILSFLSPLEDHADVPLQILTTKYGVSVSEWTLGITCKYTHESTGITFIRVQGKRHCVDQPAVVRRDGEKLWYLNDVLHRDEIQGPAIEKANGDKKWYCNGVLHRLHGPAVEDANGDREWYVNGLRHRTDAPAIHRKIHKSNQDPQWDNVWHGRASDGDDGDKEWWVNGKRHRDENIGPAIIYANGHKEWYLRGKFLRSSYDFD